MGELFNLPDIQIEGILPRPHDPGMDAVRAVRSQCSADHQYRRDLVEHWFITLSPVGDRGLIFREEAAVFPVGKVASDCRG